ncbi:MAG: hypothetical protein SFU25_06070, partial [Candidatus Caenarcaniphilales bacterium]|nr:hypothetical protein [Candidatus Caenarcaniphilales bacterium]
SVFNAARRKQAKRTATPLEVKFGENKIQILLEKAAMGNFTIPQDGLNALFDHFKRDLENTKLALKGGVKKNSDTPSQIVSNLMAMIEKRKRGIAFGQKNMEIVARALSKYNVEFLFNGQPFLKDSTEVPSEAQG